MGRKLRNAPVYFALVQARFNAILNLEQYLPAIQESFRKSKYPDFQQRHIATFNLNLAKQQKADEPAGAVQQIQYLFLNQEGTAGFILEPTSLIFHTTHYDTFEPFLADFLHGLEIVNDRAELSYTDRLGIRFLDAVVPINGVDVRVLLSPSVLSLYGMFDNRELVHAVSETRTKAGKTSLISRVFIYKHPPANPNQTVAFPPDLNADPLKLMDKFTELTGTYAVLDNDCFHENRDPFDLGRIKEICGYLKAEVSRSFRMMVSDSALKMWE